MSLQKVPAEPVMPSRRQQLRQTAIAAVLVLGCALMFVGKLPATNAQWMHHAWNFGHIGLFAGLSWVLLRYWRAALYWQLPLLLSATAVIGYAVELVQRQIGRDFSLRDVLLDVVGSGLGALVAVWQRLTWLQRGLLALPLLVASNVFVVPFVKVVWDSVQAERQFPLLAGFDSPLERRRLSYYGGTSVRVRNGAAEIHFGRDKWSGFFFFDAPRDWRGQRVLVALFDNPRTEPLQISCRINDAQHFRNNSPINDRFGRNYLLTAGRSEIRIDLAEVERAPVGRRMNMAEIVDFRCFVHRQPTRRMLLLDEVRLER